MARSARVWWQQFVEFHIITSGCVCQGPSRTTIPKQKTREQMREDHRLVLRKARLLMPAERREHMLAADRVRHRRTVLPTFRVIAAASITLHYQHSNTTNQNHAYLPLPSYHYHLTHSNS